MSICTGDYLFVMFRDIGPVFLHEHFKHRLRVHLLHSEITDDHPSKVIISILQELGLWERDDEEAHFDDRRRSTEMGKEIFQRHLFFKFEGNGYESSRDNV